MARIPPRHSTLATAFMAALLPGLATAASFQILEQSPALQGTSFAGTASSATDASTVFFNPAAMSMLDGSHFTAGGNLILPEAKFDNDGSTAATGTALEQPLSGPNDTTDETGFVPNFYYVRPINEQWTFGLGVNAPFGLTSSYDDDWVGRYHATDSELTLLNINPTFAFRASERVSLGIGLNYQRIDATLENEVDSFSACVGATGNAANCVGGGFGTAVTPGNRSQDSSSKVEGDDENFTLDLSVLFQVNQATRVGAVFRQGGDFTLDGDINFDRSDACNTNAGCTAALDASEGDIEADVEIPDTLTVSISHVLDSRWTLHGDVAWTQWSSIDEVEIVAKDDGQVINTLDLDYDDTMRYAFGATYSDGGPWTWRGGIAFDEAPQTDPEHQTPRVPDQDRTWLSAGFNYAVSPTASIDFGYTHILVDDIDVDITNDQGHTLTGDFDASVNILAVQGNWTF